MAEQMYYRADVRAEIADGMRSADDLTLRFVHGDARIVSVDPRDGAITLAVSGPLVEVRAN